MDLRMKIINWLLPDAYLISKKEEPIDIKSESKDTSLTVSQNMTAKNEDLGEIVVHGRQGAPIVWGGETLQKE